MRETSYVLTVEYGGVRFVPDAAHKLLMLRLAEQAQRLEELERLVEMAHVEMPVCIECGRQPVTTNDLLCDHCLTAYGAWQEHYGPKAILFAEAEDTPLLPPVDASEEASANAEAVAYLFELQPEAVRVDLWWKPSSTEYGMTLLYTYDREPFSGISCAVLQEAGVHSHPRN